MVVVPVFLAAAVVVAAAVATAVVAAATPAAATAAATTGAAEPAAATAAGAAVVSAGVVLAVADRREVECDRQDRVDVRGADALQTGVLERRVRVGRECGARLRALQQAHQEVEQCRCDVCHDQFPSSKANSVTETSSGLRATAFRVPRSAASVRTPLLLTLTMGIREWCD